MEDSLTLGRRHRSRMGLVSVTLTDPELLDCTVCFNTLTPTIYQCEQGHMVCSHCWAKITKSICPTCRIPVGYDRCHALERILESALISCGNGCNEKVALKDKQVHQESYCVYAPCTCPRSRCSFSGPVQQLCRHYKSNHEGRSIGFNFDTTSLIEFTRSDKLLILQELKEGEKQGLLFLLNNFLTGDGHVIKITCMGPSSYQGKFFCKIIAKNWERRYLKFESFVEIVQKRDNDAPTENFLLLPGSFIGYDNINISLEVCIYQVDKYLN
ncbi:E3 ubiquitin-protein ligase SINA-like 10 [Linum perenne]